MPFLMNFGHIFTDLFHFLSWVETGFPHLLQHLREVHLGSDYSSSPADILADAEDVLKEFQT